MGQKPADAGVSRYGVGCAHARRRTALRDAAAGGISGGAFLQVILSKRENFRRAFDGFDPHKIAAYGEDKVGELLKDAGIVRCRRKIEAAVINARCFLEIQRQFGSFANYLYSFTGGQAQLIGGEARTTSPLSDAIARDLKRRGMRYMGSVTVYSYLQAVGVVNDHEPGCFLHRARKGG